MCSDISSSLHHDTVLYPAGFSGNTAGRRERRSLPKAVCGRAEPETTTRPSHCTLSMAALLAGRRARRRGVIVQSGRGRPAGIGRPLEGRAVPWKGRCHRLAAPAPPSPNPSHTHSPQSRAARSRLAIDRPFRVAHAGASNPRGPRARSCRGAWPRRGRAWPPPPRRWRAGRPRGAPRPRGSRSAAARRGRRAWRGHPGSTSP